MEDVPEIYVVSNSEDNSETGILLPDVERLIQSSNSKPRLVHSPCKHASFKECIESKFKCCCIFTFVCCIGLAISLIILVSLSRSLFCQSGNGTGLIIPVLVGGSNPSEGQVFVLDTDQHSSLRAVCDLGWNLKNAEIVCRQLGNYENAKPTFNSTFLNGTYDLYRFNFNCQGSEASLIECERIEDKSDKCNKNNFAGVICS